VRRLAAWALSLALLALGAGALVRSPLFAFRQLIVKGPGAARVTPRVLGLGPQTSLLLVAPAALARKALWADPWARAAQVEVRLPHAVSLILLPRQPVAVVAQGTRLYAVDGQGMVLPTTPAAARSLPFLGGLGKLIPGRLATSEPARQVVAVARALPPSLRAQVSQVQALPGGQVELVLMDGRPCLLGSASFLAQKLSDLQALLRRYPWPEYAGTGFDLRDPLRPTLYPAARA
jgi:cell division septal protein FtsQ